MRQSSKRGERRSAAQMHALTAVRREVLSRDSCGTRKYLREYTQAFQNFEGVLTTEEFEQAIASASVLLIGDYHALAASQRYAARLIEQVAAKGPVVVCVEAILSRNHAILDAWWRREIGSDELRTRLRFDRDWGYPWEPFLDVLTAARDHAEALYGLDSIPREDMRRIRARDKHAATKITEARQRHPDAKIVVLFGESHLAPDHLPRFVKEALPSESLLTILQNVDALYWEAVGTNSAVLSIRPDAVCVFNSSLVEKYESYRLCLDRWNGDDHDDFTPAVYNVIFALAKTIGFKLNSPHNGTQPKYLADSLPEVINAAAGSNEIKPLAGEKVRSILSIIEDTGCRYDPETNRFFVREFKMPAIAAEASRFLWHACRNFSTARAQEAADIDALEYFGARLLCPESASKTNPTGEELYQSYIAGRVSRSKVRKMFLA